MLEANSASPIVGQCVGAMKEEVHRGEMAPCQQQAEDHESANVSDDDHPVEMLNAAAAPLPYTVLLQIWMLPGKSSNVCGFSTRAAPPCRRVAG